MNKSLSIFLLLFFAITASASPVPQDTQTANTSSPTVSAETPSPTLGNSVLATPKDSESAHAASESRTFSGHQPDPYVFNTGRVFNIYYISAVCTGLAVFALLVGGGVYRYRMRQAAIARGQIPLGENNVLPARPRPANRQKKRRIVLTEEQFNLIPCEVAHGTGAAPNVSGQFKSDTDGNVKTTVTDGKPGVIDTTDWREPDACAVCIEDIVAGEKLVVLPCHHAFHVDCARPWLLKKSTSCPLCKEDVRVGLGIKITEPTQDEERIDYGGHDGTSSQGGVAVPEPARITR
ncbi:hypothetical protein FBU59_003898 [Linderina macrospora]|uniref:Uncharacterized protein n=1 Tax=Linderina macrospora TaxID=4868 RepID=A0ACC1J788_9FUNG|nr:hypothetical protein FBU59_003898 [Linderina macrospora]